MNALAPDYIGMAVKHPMKDNPTKGDIDGFARRIAERVASLCVDFSMRR